MELDLGEKKEFRPEKLIIGVLISEPEIISGIKDRLTDLYGPMDFEEGPLEFQFTHYYDEEMGTPIYKYFFSFRELVDPQNLPDIKITTNAIEADFARAGKRKVNIDPGSMAQSRFVLATTKEGSHRIPIKDGIYGEVTMQFRGGEFREQEWTYPDFRSDVYKRILNKIREIYNYQLKELGLRQPNYKKLPL